MNKNPEHNLQVRCVKWFYYQYPFLRQLFFAVPNGGYRYKKTASYLKAEGQRSGVADLILLLPNYYYHSLNIEMKDKSNQTKNQIIYQNYCKLSSNLYIICRSFEGFQLEVNKYLSSVDKNILFELECLYKSIEKEKIEESRKRFEKIKELYDKKK